MRITVNLGIFFHDHRSLAKIFINQHMKSIKDVEKHIEKIFHIKNFYLKCANEYLPPTEDVNILNNDDFVWVVPLGESTNSTENPIDISVESEEIADELPKLPKKKKRRHDVCDNTPKKKKVKTVETPMSDDIMETEDSPQIVKKKKKKKKHEKKDLPEKEEEPNKIVENGISPKDSGRDSFESVKSDDKRKIQSIINTFENKQTDFGKKFISLPFTQNERKINIVKTIIISNGNKTTQTEINPSQPSEKNSTEFKPDNESTPIASILKNDKKSSGDSLNRIHFDSKKESPITSILESDKKSCDSLNKTHFNSTKEGSTMSEADMEGVSSEETVSIASRSTFSGYDINVNKRRRRRRSHRRKGNSVNRGPNLPEVENIQIMKTPSKQTPTHVKFTDDVEEAKDKDEPQNENLDSRSNEVVVVEEPQTNGTNENSPKTFQLEDTLKDLALEDFIGKQPITKNIVPRVGEVVSFKILKLSENYTPELSTTIVGKVVNYIPEKKEVTFDVVYGWEECSQPQGKFSLEEGSNADTNRKFQCVWENLLEPRVIFP